MTILAWCVAWLLDFIIGDPQNWPHPVRWIGNLISAVQRIIRRYCHSDRALRIGGAVMWIVVVGLTWAASWGAGTGKIFIPGWVGGRGMDDLYRAGRAMPGECRTGCRTSSTGR
jgi:adenosylcobinamide-phosphate synthase